MMPGKLRHASKYMAVKFFSETKKWSIDWMCRQLEISRAAYYKWLHREIPKCELKNIELALYDRYPVIGTSNKIQGRNTLEKGLRDAVLF